MQMLYPYLIRTNIFWLSIVLLCSRCYNIDNEMVAWSCCSVSSLLCVFSSVHIWKRINISKVEHDCSQPSLSIRKLSSCPGDLQRIVSIIINYMQGIIQDLLNGSTPQIIHAPLHSNVSIITILMLWSICFASKYFVSFLEWSFF